MKRLLAIILIYCFSLPLSLAKPINVIIYSATAWYRHPEIPQLNGFLVRLGAENNVNVSVTENPSDLKYENLKNYNLLLFNKIWASVVGGAVLPERVLPNVPVHGLDTIAL